MESLGKKRAKTRCCLQENVIGVGKISFNPECIRHCVTYWCQLNNCNCAPSYNRKIIFTNEKLNFG